MKRSNVNKNVDSASATGKTKKLVQLRLQFPLLPKTTIPTENRKRKLSVDDDQRNVKIGRKSLETSSDNGFCIIPSDGDNLDRTINLNCQESIDDAFSREKNDFQLNQSADILHIDVNPSDLDPIPSDSIIISDSDCEKQDLNEKRKYSIENAAKDTEFIISSGNSNKELTEVENENIVQKEFVKEVDEMENEIIAENENISIKKFDVLKEADKDSILDDSIDVTNILTDSDNDEINIDETTIKCSKIINEPLMSKSVKLTPKQVLKRLENEKKKENRQKLKDERDRKIQEEKELRQKDKDDKEKLRKKEREEKEEQRKKERKDKEEKEQKRLDDRKKKECEEETRKKRASDAFTKFFKNPKIGEELLGIGSNSNDEEIRTVFNFMPFRIKENMKLAPTVRRIFTEQEKCSMDKLLVKIDSNEDMNYYLNSFKSGKGHSERTWTPNSSDIIFVDDEIDASSGLIEESQPKAIFRAKFLLFNENRRPPYYGTWRKHSEIVRPRRPFASDKKFFDYEIDSDDEWEEDEPGESLNGSEDEKDKESEDDYEVDNEFFVPHGYLSEEENNEDEGVTNDDNSPETQKLKLKILQQEFVDEMKKKTEKIKPRLIGCIWMDRNGGIPETCPTLIGNLLIDRSMITDSSISFKKSEISNSCNISPDDKLQTNSRRPKTMSVDEIKDLIHLIHGNTHSRNFLIKEYNAFRRIKKLKNVDDKGISDCAEEEEIKEISKRMLSYKIKEIAKWGKYPEQGPMFNKFCWYVSTEKLENYQLSEILTIPNTWNYTLQPTRIEATSKIEKTEKEQNTISVITPTLDLVNKNSIELLNDVTLVPASCLLESTGKQIVQNVTSDALLPRKVQSNLMSKFLQIDSKEDSNATPDNNTNKKYNNCSHNKTEIHGKLLTQEHNEINNID